MTDIDPDFSDLRALFINCTLKRSPEISHTEGLIRISSAIMERHGVGVVVEAELGGAAALGRDHVGALDARRRRQLVGEPGDAGVVGVGRVGEQDVEVEAERVGHRKGRRV